jgi:hypothetical protein
LGGEGRVERPAGGIGQDVVGVAGGSTEALPHRDLSGGRHVTAEIGFAGDDGAVLNPTSAIRALFRLFRAERTRKSQSRRDRAFPKAV